MGPKGVCGRVRPQRRLRGFRKLVEHGHTAHLAAGMAGAVLGVEHAAGSIGCDVGYELAIAKQAVAINPRLTLYGLQWGAPSWAGANGSLFTGADIRYLLDWLGCARQYGLTISYLGGWNERDDGSHVAWFRSLRLALNSGGYQNVRIVAGDGVGNAKWVTMAGQGKGTATSPPAADLGLPYRNDLSASAGVPGMPGLLAPQDGAFQLAPCHSLNGSATCTMQAAVGQPVLWSHQVPDRHPDAIIGADWADYSVSVDAMVPAPDQPG